MLVRRLVRSDSVKLTLLEAQDIIETIAKRNERPVEWSQRVLFSCDTNKVNGISYKIPDTEIYENTGYSASHIMSIIRMMLA